MFNKTDMVLMIISPQLETASKLLAAKDANSTGKDDLLAAILHYAHIAIDAVENDRELPALPEVLKA